MTLIVADWDENFENSRTREVQKMHWVPVPTKQDGDGYTELLDHDEGAAHFGAWVAILQVAAKCDHRGRLERSRGERMVDHDAASLSRVTRVPLQTLEVAISRLLEIGWLSEVTEPTAVACGAVAEDRDQIAVTCGAIGSTSRKNAPTVQYSTEQDSTEQNTSCSELPQAEPTEPAGSTDEPTEFVFPCSGKGKPDWTLTVPKLNEYAEAFPGIDLDAELRKARQWCRDHPKRRKTPGGMPKFLWAWLGKAQNQSRGSPPPSRGKYTLDPTDGSPF